MSLERKLTKTLKSRLRLAAMVSLAGIASAAMILENANASPCSGTRCGGGGATIRGQTVDRYLAERRVRNRSQLDRHIASRMERIRALDPELYASIQRDINELNWYFVDDPLIRLPFQRSRIPFATNQACMQIDDNVMCNRREFNRLKTDEDRGDMIIHEVFMRRALRLEGINPNFSLTNVWRAVELLSSESLRGNPNLREEMALLGFSRSPARQATTAPEIARLADSEQFVEIPLQVPANSIITVASLQEAQSACNLATSIEILESALPLIPSNMHSAYRSGMENMRSSGARAIRFENGSLANLAPPSSANSLTTPSRFPAPPGEYSTSFGFFPAGTETRGDFSRTLTDRPDQLPYFSLRVAGGEDSPILNPQGVRARLRTDALWPRVTYSLNLMDRTHLPLGGVNPQLRLRDLRVVVPQRVLAQQNGVYRFSNVETSVETEVQANGKTYIECLQRKLTENAQTSGSETGQGTGGGTGQTPAR